MIAAKTKVIILEKFFSEMDEISLFFLLDWLNNFTGILILFGECHFSKNLNRSPKIVHDVKFKNIFNKTILFTADGIAKKI